MKTPREIYLHKHRAAQRNLDTIRIAVLRRFPKSPEEETVEAQGSWLSQLWRELLWPCRRILLGLAPVWLIILLLRLAAFDRGDVRTAAAIPAPQMIPFLREQQRMMAELSDLPLILPQAPAERPRSARLTLCRFT